jgi:hypothetical protein
VHYARRLFLANSSTCDERGDIGVRGFTCSTDRDHERQGAAEAKTVMVTYDYAANKSVPIPDLTRELLRSSARRAGR